MGKPVLPDVWVNVQDGALGILPPPSENVSAKIGVAAQGPIGKILTFTDIAQVKETLGGGPLAEAIATHLALSGAPVYAVRIPGNVTADNKQMNSTAQGAGKVFISARDNDKLSVVVEIRSDSPGDGSLGGTFAYSLDGGKTFKGSFPIPFDGVFTIPEEGVTITFAPAATGGGSASDSAFKRGDRFNYTLPASEFSPSDLKNALDVLLRSPLEFSWVHIVGNADLSMAAAVATKMREAETRHRYAFALLEEPSDDPDSSWDTFADVRVAVAAGTASVVSPMTGRSAPRSIAWLASGRMASIPVHEHLGRIATGAVQGVVSISHDEAAEPRLDQRGFITMRSVIGRRGYYFTRGRIKAPEGSDFQFVETRRVMDQACRIARNAALRFLNDTVRINDEGAILEVDARAIEAYVEGALISGIITPGHASVVQVRLKRDSNVISTRSTTLTIRVRPLGYLEYIEIDLAFDNPALGAKK